MVRKYYGPTIPDASGGSGGFNPLDMVLPGIGSALSFGLGQWGANNAQNRAIDMFNMQHQAAIDDWNRNNQYNSPAAQMGRFKDAGLNPNLIYGQMSNAPAVKTPDASAGLATNNSVDLSGGVAHLAAARQAAAQTKLLDAETYKTQQEGYAATKDGDLKQAQIDSLRGSANLSNTSASNINALQAPSIERINSETDFNRQRIINEIANLDLTKQKTLQSKAETANTWTAEKVARVMLAPNRDLAITHANLAKTQQLAIPSEVGLRLSQSQHLDAQKVLTDTENRLKNFDLGKLKSGSATGHDSYPYRILDDAANKLNQLLFH